MVLGAGVIIIVGLLVINYFRGLDEGTIIPSINTQDLQVQLPTTHTIASGEDLWKISEKYYQTGYNWVDIAEENNISNPNSIIEGQELTIPDVEPRSIEKENGVIETAEVSEEIAATNDSQETKPEETTVIESEERAEAIAGATYTVERGDTLWDIAVRAYGDGFRWTEIASENDLANPHLIHAGNVFALPR